jgi:signal transduction histidine kinase
LIKQFITNLKITKADTLGLSNSDSRRFYLTGKFSVYALLVNLVFIINDFFTVDNAIIFKMDIAIVIIHCSILLYFRITKNHFYTSLILLLFLNVELFATASFYTKQSNIALFFFPIMMLTYSLIDHKQKKLWYGFFTLTAILFFIIIIFDFKVICYGEIDPKYINEVADLTTITTIIVLFIFLNTTMNTIIQNEEKLEAETESLKILNITLFELNTLKINYSAKLEAELQAAQIKLEQKERELKLAALQAHEMERKRLAQDLHDELGVKLSVLKMNLSNFENNFIHKNHEDYLQIMHLVDDACHQIRTISHNMHPALFEEQGLVNILKDVISNINKANKIEIKFVVIDYTQQLNPQKELLVYRIILELLNNVLKHASATLINLQIIYNNQSVTILLDDNGVGFDEQTAKKGLGLNGILHRTNAMNAKWKIESKNNKGTFNIIEIPIN